MVTKLVENLDSTQWNNLKVEATRKGVKMGDLLSDILKERYK